MRRMALGAALALVGTAGCAKVARVEVPAAPLVFTAAGQHQAIAPRALDQHGRPMAKARFRFTSSDPKVATVDAEGAVTSVRSGTASIEVTSGGREAAVQVDVRIPAKLVASPVTLSGVGSKAALAAKVLDGLGRPVEGVTVAFALADPSVAMINGASLTSLNIGKTTVTATFGALRATAPVTVTLPPFDRLEVTPAKVSVNAGSAAFLTVAATDQKGAGVDGVHIDFASSDPRTATVDAGGKIMGVAPGEATVTATAGGKSAVVSVTVSGR